jgi:glucose-1-phosphate thymidylyltransferase
MNVILLCAGFATRMYPLTKDFPKPLLAVAGKPVIDYLMEQVIDLPEITSIYLVTNHRFFQHFDKWAQQWRQRLQAREILLQVYNDGATTNDNRWGAVGDLHYVMQRIDAPGPIIVSAGDNIYRFAINPLWKRFLESRHHHIVAVPESNPEKLKQTGVPIFGDSRRVIRINEKPQNPPSQWCCPPIYFLKPSAWTVLNQFQRSSPNRDAPGYFIDFLCRRENVYAFKLNSSRLDIGSLETYRLADRLLKNESAVH